MCIFLSHPRRTPPFTDFSESDPTPFPTFKTIALPIFFVFIPSDIFPFTVLRLAEYGTTPKHGKKKWSTDFVLRQ